MMNEDKEYVLRLKADDFSAFDVLFHKYSSNLYAFVLSLTHHTFIAEEITQLVFLKVWEKRLSIDEDLSFKSFLFSITYNETISWLRKENSEKRKIQNYLLQTADYTNETEQKIEFTNFEFIAQKLINEMPGKRQEIFRMSRESGFSNNEIAQRLNISVKTVENQITSSLKYLRENLGRNGILGLLFYFIVLHY